MWKRLNSSVMSVHQVKDVEIKPTPSLNEGISLKNAWNKMRDLRESTMPIVNDGVLEGIISVKDIATANMDIYETRILAISHTKYTNVLDAIDGTMIVGDSEEEITKGKILIGAANPDLLENYVEDGDMLLTGNRFENQLCGIEMNAGCIVVCTGAPISKTIQKLAKENNCKIISTPHEYPDGSKTDFSVCTRALFYEKGSSDYLQQRGFHQRHP